MTSPATGTMSLIATGTPANGNRSPAATRRMTSRASHRAASVRTVSNAARTSSCLAMRASASASTGTDALDKQLQGKNFFDAAQFPNAKFVADKFSFDGDKVTEVAGTLTLRGVTHPVTLKATLFNCYLNPLLKREVCGGDFETTIQRSLWGITWGLDLGIPDRVRLLVQVEAVRQ